MSADARPAKPSALVQGGGLLHPYEPGRGVVDPASLFGPTPGQVRLSGNENPFGPAPSALKAVADVAAMGCYYVDRAVFHLTAMIAERHGVHPNQVVLGAGTTEILCAADVAWGRDGTIVCPELFWDAPVHHAERIGVTCLRVPLAPDLGIDLDAMERAVGPGVSLVHLVNPNNPTGLLLDNQALRAFARRVQASGATLLVDEAYNELTDLPDANSLVDLVRAGEDVIVCRTFSKIYGMAGLRVGYALTSESNALRLRSVMTSFGGNAAGLAAAIASFDDRPFLHQSLALVREGRDMVMDAVGQAGLIALPSQTNFIFVEVSDADTVRDAMAGHNVIIRGSFGDKWRRYSRVSVGALADVRIYCQLLPGVIAGIAAQRR